MSLSWERVCYASLLFGVHMITSACSQSESNAVGAENSAAAQRDTPPVPQATGKRILAFGDSLYAGYGLAPSESFPAVLEQALRQSGTAATVHNAGVSGDTSAAALQRLQFTLEGLSDTPDLAIVGLGGNDMLRGLDPSQTEANLLAICRELRGRGTRVVLTGMLAAPNLGADYARRFNGLFPRVAERCGAALYPFFLDDVVTDPALMLPDRIHPNAQGIRRIVSEIQPLIVRQLKSASADPKMS